MYCWDPVFTTTVSIYSTFNNKYFLFSVHYSTCCYRHLGRIIAIPDDSKLLSFTLNYYFHLLWIILIYTAWLVLPPYHCSNFYIYIYIYIFFFFMHIWSFLWLKKSDNGPLLKIKIQSPNAYVPSQQTQLISCIYTPSQNLFLFTITLILPLLCFQRKLLFNFKKFKPLQSPHLILLHTLD